MAHALKLLFALLLCIFVQGKSDPCALSSIEVQQMNTGLMAGYDPVFEVEVKNGCGCSVARVYLYSRGFASSTPVDPSLFRRDGVGYLANEGQSIASGASVKFRYAWDRPFQMGPENRHVEC
ncbi:protein TAPETUM DETERMINANT 1-like isoform X2 [Ananas comosus]|uniref:Protein TAPETUM DETERMINANT 1-like isoform X2 n=1 Tax=Ananas comosus TaxID=4615 RepID=A0A6P5GGW0_ANACO|nr:protein TAPETUM DETERMINANT 1-like isoform X2 [Ananas comosus]